MHFTLLGSLFWDVHTCSPRAWVHLIHQRDCGKLAKVRCDYEVQRATHLLTGVILDQDGRRTENLVDRCGVIRVCTEPGERSICHEPIKPNEPRHGGQRGTRHVAVQFLQASARGTVVQPDARL